MLVVTHSTKFCGLDVDAITFFSLLRKSFYAFGGFMIGLFMETYWNRQRRVHKTFIIKFSTIFFFSFGFQLSTTFVSLQRIIFYLENDKQERQLYKAGHIEQQAKWCMCTLSCNDPSTMKSLKKKLSDIFTYQWLTEITFLSSK